MKEQTPERRLDQLQGRIAKVADEIEAIDDEEAAHTTIVNGEEFDNLAWLLAEAQETDEEVGQVLSVVTPDMEIPYEEGFTEFP